MPARAVAPLATGASQAHPVRPPARRPIPGQQARWEFRAYASLVDIAVAAGILTAWQMTLLVLGPLLRVAAWLGDASWSSFIPWSTYLLMASWWGWQWLQRGSTGQSLGQRLIGVAVVDQETHAPVGPVRSLVRSLTHALDVLPLWIGMARPAWDPWGQTWADKIHRTIALEVATPARIE